MDFIGKILVTNDLYALPIRRMFTNGVSRSARAKFNIALIWKIYKCLIFHRITNNSLFWTLDNFWNEILNSFIIWLKTFVRWWINLYYSTPTWVRQCEKYHKKEARLHIQLYVLFQLNFRTDNVSKIGRLYCSHLFWCDQIFCCCWVIMKTELIHSKNNVANVEMTWILFNNLKLANDENDVSKLSSRFLRRKVVYVNFLWNHFRNGTRIVLRNWNFSQIFIA